jgi:hypothetical protein
MDTLLKPPLRALAFFVLAACINELCLYVIAPRILLLIWAFMFLWMFNDSIWVAVDLTCAEKMLADQKRMNEILQAQNFASSLQLLQTAEHHKLLSEIKLFLQLARQTSSRRPSPLNISPLQQPQDSFWMLDLHQKLNVVEPSSKCGGVAQKVEETKK